MNLICLDYSVKIHYNIDILVGQGGECMFV